MDTGFRRYDKTLVAIGRPDQTCTGIFAKEPAFAIRNEWVAVPSGIGLRSNIPNRGISIMNNGTIKKMDTCGHFESEINMNHPAARGGETTQKQLGSVNKNMSKS